MNFKHTIRLFSLMILLNALFLGVGFYFAGSQGLLIGLVLGLLFNIGSYWYSDIIVLRMYKAKPLEDKELNKIIEELSQKAGIPKPRLMISDLPVPNAFATGRNPEHGVVCVTKGLLQNLSKNEIKAVVAHEIGHIKHRDTLIQTLSASIASAITWLGYMFLFGDDEGNAFGMLLMFILVPIAASMIRLAISRSREYYADEESANLNNPNDLINALKKISYIAKNHPIRGNSSTSSMFIVNPFSLKGLQSLFSTHPSLEDRVQRLSKM